MHLQQHFISQLSELSLIRVNHFMKIGNKEMFLFLKGNSNYQMSQINSKILSELEFMINIQEIYFKLKDFKKKRLKNN